MINGNDNIPSFRMQKLRHKDTENIPLDFKTFQVGFKQRLASSRVCGLIPQGT